MTQFCSLSPLSGQRTLLQDEDSHSITHDSSLTAQLDCVGSVVCVEIIQSIHWLTNTYTIRENLLTLTKKTLHKLTLFREDFWIERLTAILNSMTIMWSLRPATSWKIYHVVSLIEKSGISVKWVKRETSDVVKTKEGFEREIVGEVSDTDEMCNCACC